ncbi:DUF2515 family protein [Alkalihalobacillus sp. NPDC078783]
MNHQIQQYSSILEMIKKQLKMFNMDNLTRTSYYERFYHRHPEIRWALLAGLVSRNAGWNMTDLANEWFRTLLPVEDRNRLFAIYEASNWTIFQDACPQLMIYEQSKYLGRPLFFLLKEFGVSSFIINEWHMFWEKHSEERLCTALIINEQFVLEEAVLQKPLFKDIVSRKIFFHLEQHTHLSYVLLPSVEGCLYTLYVRPFQRVSNRIKLGKQLAFLLFHPDTYPSICSFMNHHPHTGSRHDYDQRMSWSPRVESYPLRFVYPVIEHQSVQRGDWSYKHTKIAHYFTPVKPWKPVSRDEWVQRKWMMIYLAKTVKKWIR